VSDEKKSERIPVVLTPSLLARIEDWRFARRLGSRSDAIRQLIERGLASSEPDEPPKAGSLCGKTAAKK
jgi:metal-responsive CopG/Arc/MetJ family transcriptional regulator